MNNPFSTLEMAAGYARSRPPVHHRIIARASAYLPPRCLRALDIGCGAGLSTSALQGIAGKRFGIDPAESMIRMTATGDPGANFAVGAAEALPFTEGSIDLITAAGSLNYVDLDVFFVEAANVLSERGVLVVYDF